MQVRNTPPAIVPSPDKLRAWASDCFAILNVSAARMSRELGLGRNTLGDFMSQLGRGISLSTAHVFVCKAHEIAHAQGKTLPPLEV